VEQCALSAGYVTLLGNANERVDQQDRYLDSLISRRVDGIIVAPQGGDSASIRALIKRNIPTVFVDRVIADIDLPSVTTNSDTGIHQAVAHLAEARPHPHRLSSARRVSPPAANATPLSPPPSPTTG
jgi:LacI family transcriptional regulator